MPLHATNDERDLREAVEILEFPTFTARASKYIGKPIELIMNALPTSTLNQVSKLTEASLKVAFRAVLLTVDEQKRFQKARNLAHKSMVVASGAVGGFFGGVTMAIELPVSTGIMMRSIAEIAREQGEDLSGAESRLACLAVLGLDTSRSRGGSPSWNTSQYFFLRKTLAAEVTKAVEYLAENALAEESAPIIAKLLNKIAERFGIVITEKMASELVPVIGAVAGGGINYIFIDHFQRIARGHFIVRRLERKYGSARIETEYASVLQRIAMEKSLRKDFGGEPYDIPYEVYDEAAATTDEKDSVVDRKSTGDTTTKVHTPTQDDAATKDDTAP